MERSLCSLYLPGMDARRAENQLRLIIGIMAMSGRLGVQVWLRGGWAVDFFLGQVTRDHVDIDWFAWIDDAPVITAALHTDGYETIPGPPSDQQLDVAKDGEELSFAWLARGEHGEVTVAGGRYAGAPWPDGMLERPSGRIGQVQCPIISPEVQIESRENDAGLDTGPPETPEGRGRHRALAPSTAIPRAAVDSGGRECRLRDPVDTRKTRHVSGLDLCDASPHAEGSSAGLVRRCGGGRDGC